MWAIGEPTGPMLKGITYIVRPFITPSNFGVSRAFILSGSIQLLVGPASASSLASRCRCGLRRGRRRWDGCGRGSESGRSSGLSLMNVPLATISSQRRSYSSCEPLHQ